MNKQKAKIEFLGGTIEMGSRGDGFHATFPNNCTLSVQWHKNSYAVAGESVEIGAWDARNDWISLAEGTIVATWVPIEEIENWAKKIADRV